VVSDETTTLKATLPIGTASDYHHFAGESRHRCYIIRRQGLGSSQYFDGIDGSVRWRRFREVSDLAPASSHCIGVEVLVGVDDESWRAFPSHGNKTSVVVNLKSRVTQVSAKFKGHGDCTCVECLIATSIIISRRRPFACQSAIMRSIPYLEYTHLLS
jgi:hypothetical protein